MMSEQAYKEMTLEDWVGGLPEGHVARVELATLKKRNEELRIERNRLYGIGQEYDKENAALKRIKEAAQYEIDNCGFCKRGMECKASHAKLRDALLTAEEQE